MKFREKRHNDKPEPDNDPQGTGPQGSKLKNLRSAGEKFIAAGDEAIRKAISNGNSEAFLAASRQAGGQ